LGVHLHGLAGDLAAEELGEVSLIASDLVRLLPAAVKTAYGDAE
jgi:NAD(P)H-hydrate epimerase